MEDDCEVHGVCRVGNNERRLEVWWGPRDEKTGGVESSKARTAVLVVV